jgi:hypothetical protein
LRHLGALTDAQHAALRRRVLDGPDLSGSELSTLIKKMREKL